MADKWWQQIIFSRQMTVPSVIINVAFEQNVAADESTCSLTHCPFLNKWIGNDWISTYGQASRAASWISGWREDFMRRGILHNPSVWYFMGSWLWDTLGCRPVSATSRCHSAIAVVSTWKIQLCRRCRTSVFPNVPFCSEPRWNRALEPF